MDQYRRKLWPHSRSGVQYFPAANAAITQALLADPEFRVAVEAAGSPGAVITPESAYTPELTTALDNAFARAREMQASIRVLLSEAQQQLEALVRQEPR